MRLIDADALKENITFTTIMYDRDLILHVPLKDIDTSIDKAPTIGGWISVEDRMPTAYEDVLCYAVKGWIWRRFIGWLNGDEWVLDGIDDGVKATHLGWEVTHWMPLPEPLMPLPEPPKEGSLND